jgi:hypothetical protein
MHLVNFLKALTRHMGIDLRGRDISMTEQKLHHTQICTMVQQMSCERMS